MDIFVPKRNAQMKGKSYLQLFVDYIILIKLVKHLAFSL